MSKMKAMIGMAAMMAAMAYGGTSGTTPAYEPKETDEERKARFAKAEAESNKEKGLKEFFYNGKSLWALNQKSADKKAKKQGWV